MASGPIPCPFNGKGFEYMLDIVLLARILSYFDRLRSSLLGADIVLVFLAQKVGKVFLFSIISHSPDMGRGFSLCDGL